jgi:hypothetical protein
MAKSINLLTLADGFGDSIACPRWYPEYTKWPEIIKLMTKGVNLINLSRYGAGNEYITYCLKENIKNKNKILVQWAGPARLDLLLDSNNQDCWMDEIDKDPMYSDNVVKLNNLKFWISSASTNPYVRDYHDRYIGKKQHELRSLIYIDYIKMLLEKENIDYKFFLSIKNHYLKDLPSVDNWVWHEPFFGMCEFRNISKYAELDLEVIQPIPLVHFDFIQKFIMPVMDLPWRSQKEIEAVGNMLYRKYQLYAKNKPLTMVSYLNYNIT